MITLIDNNINVIIYNNYNSNSNPKHDFRNFTSIDSQLIQTELAMYIIKCSGTPFYPLLKLLFN